MKAFRRIWLMAPLAILAAACGKSAPDDAALKNDLALASQSFVPNQVISPTEQGLAANPYTTPVQRQPTVRAATRPTATVRRTSTAPRSSAGTVYSEPAPRPTQTVKNTKRDAAIGAVAGAVIGATASRDKVKGGLIGAAAGAILGGVIGNNVDVKKIPY
jgi:uncharacterized protein YcfJ